MQTNIFDFIRLEYKIKNKIKLIELFSGYGSQALALKLKLKDMLEQNVDEKYFLSDKMLQCFMSDGTGKYPRKERFLANIYRENEDIGNSITTLAGNRATDNFVLIKNATKQGYLEATDGDTIGIVVKDTPNYIEWEEKGKLDIDCRAWKENAIAPTTTTPKNKVLLNNLRIRKLTPKECWRLMGVRDEDYENVVRNQSNASLYHLAGDSIVVNVLMAIFKQLL